MTKPAGWRCDTDKLYVSVLMFQTSSDFAVVSVTGMRYAPKMVATACLPNDWQDSIRRLSLLPPPAYVAGLGDRLTDLHFVLPVEMTFGDFKQLMKPL